jgi:hypothetical protein
MQVLVVSKDHDNVVLFASGRGSGSDLAVFDGPRPAEGKKEKKTRERLTDELETHVQRLA